MGQGLYFFVHNFLLEPILFPLTSSRIWLYYENIQEFFGIFDEKGDLSWI
jgi:hypothetical protein